MKGIMSKATPPDAALGAKDAPPVAPNGAGDQASQSAQNPDEGAPGAYEPNSQADQQATPAEQDAYTRVVLSAAKVVYGDASHQQIMQTLQGGQDPASALAQVTSSLMIEMDKKSGGKIPEAVILPASMEVLDMLAELADKAGLFKVDDQVMTGAAQQVVLKLMQEYGVDPAEVQAMIKKIDPAKVKEMVAQQQSAAGSWAGDQGQQQGAPAAQPDQPPDQQQQPQGAPA